MKTSGRVWEDAVKDFRCLEDSKDCGIGFGRVIRQTNEPYIVVHTVQVVRVWAA